MTVAQETLITHGILCQDIVRTAKGEKKKGKENKETCGAADSHHIGTCMVDDDQVKDRQDSDAETVFSSASKFVAAVICSSTRSSVGVVQLMLFFTKIAIRHPLKSWSILTPQIQRS
eukprot:2313770-Amphidinium_carterae.1